jgi:hypothetical protein
MLDFFILVWWLFFSVAAGMFAQVRRNREGPIWGVIALVFSPLVAFTLLAILLPLPPQPERAPREADAGPRRWGWASH